MTDPKRILVRGPNWIGDHVMARTFYLGLRQRFPRARVTCALAQGPAGLDDGDLFDEKIALGRPERKLLGAVTHTAARLREGNFDLAVTLPASFSSAAMLFAARIPERVGFAETAGAWLLTRSLPWRGRASGLHKSELYGNLLSLFDARPEPFRVGAPAAAVEETIVIAPGASIALRQWPRMAELVETLVEKFPRARFVLVGGPAETAWGEAFARLERGRWENRIGATSLLELVEICRRARLVVANDSGIAHVAASLAGAPTVVLFGPGDPSYVLPRGRAVAARVAGLACSPCESAHCRAPHGYQRCLRDLTVAAVVARIDEVLT